MTVNDLNVSNSRRPAAMDIVPLAHPKHIEIPEVDTSVIARQLYRWRRQRDELFAGTMKLSGEPSWDLLLDLFVMQQDGRSVSVTGSCIGSANPTTTAIRHIARLEAAGLVSRERDKEDGRRSWLHLTDKANILLVEFLRIVADDIEHR